MQAGPPTPPPADFPSIPQTVSLQPQSATNGNTSSAAASAAIAAATAAASTGNGAIGREDSTMSLRRNKRSRRDREGTRGTSDGEDSVVAAMTSRRAGKRVRME